MCKSPKLPGHRRALVTSFEPPSTRSVSPVIQRASSEARKVIASRDIVRLREALQGLQAQREVAARIGLGEARHVGGDDAGRDGVDADAALTRVPRRNA